MSIILLNLLFGPPLFRFALVAVGEAKSHLSTLPTREAQRESVGGVGDRGSPDSSTDLLNHDQ